jgi:hypothetical protein
VVSSFDMLLAFDDWGCAWSITYRCYHSPHGVGMHTQACLCALGLVSSVPATWRLPCICFHAVVLYCSCESLWTCSHCRLLSCSLVNSRGFMLLSQAVMPCQVRHLMWP